MSPARAHILPIDWSCPTARYLLGLPPSFPRPAPSFPRRREPTVAKARDSRQHTSSASFCQNRPGPKWGGLPTSTPDEFFKTAIQVGRIVRAEPLAGARKPTYRLWIDFGESGTKQSSAQLTALYSAEDLIGRLVLAVTNFPPRQIASVRSEVLVLGLPTGIDGEVALIQPDRDIPLGSRVF